jgi:Family of unknown function (DUF5906)
MENKKLKITFDQMKHYQIDFSELNAIWQNDVKNAKTAVEKVHTEAMKKYKVKQMTDKQESEAIEKEVLENGKICEYIRTRVFPSSGKGYNIIENNEIVCKQNDWDKYKEKISGMSKQLYHKVIIDTDGLYRSKIVNNDVVVDMANKTINLAMPMDYSYSKTSKVDAINGEKILVFMKEVIVSNSVEEWGCLKYQISCMTKRQRSNIVLFLAGVGKSFFSNIIAKLLGKSFTPVSEQVISGENQFNSILLGRSCVAIEETSGTSNYSALMRGMKDMVDKETITINGKYDKELVLDNIINIMVLSNFYKDLDCGNRKIFVPTINNKYQENHKYFADLEKCLTPEALQYVFNYFYEVDTSKHMKPPQTEAKLLYKATNISSSLEFVIDKYMIENAYETHNMIMSKAYKEYQK